MSIETVETVAILTCLFVIGSVFGSLLNVCIYRLPREEYLWPALRGLVYPPSHCPRCGMAIRWRDNVPILGWLLVGGRCRNCRGKISIRYPLIELLTGVLFVAVYWCEVPDWPSGPMASSLYHSYGPTGIPYTGWMSSQSIPMWRYAFHLLLVVALIVASSIDFDLKIIPDAATLPAMAVGILGNTLLRKVYIVPLWYQTPEMQAGAPQVLKHYLDSIPNRHSLPDWFETWMTYTGVPRWMTDEPLLHGFLVSVAGILVGGGIMWGVRIVGQWGLRREAMGFGDVVLLAMIGSFIGWQGALAVFFIAPLCALAAVALAAVVRFDREIPYGPYLSLATLILLLGGHWIWPSVERILEFGPFLPAVAAFLFVLLLAGLHAMRIIQSLRGVEYEEPLGGPEPVWTAADQMAHYAGECVDDREKQWSRSLWRGELTGRGMAHYNDWRHR